MTGTIHHKICPKCGNQTIDPIDGECKYAYCDEQHYDEYIEQMNELTYLRQMREQETLIYGTTRLNSTNSV